MRYELTKDLETGNVVIDQEHKELFRAVNQLMDSCHMGQGRSAMEPAIKFLTDYVDRHFAHEEQLQQAGGYPNRAPHRVFHEEYKKKLKQIVAAIPAAGPTVGDLGNLNMQIALLVNHNRSEDKKVGAFLKQK